MKKVLFISYHFPPIGASQRALKFVKYLPKFGWSPLVLAPSNSTYPKLDYTMLAEIPRESEIIRLPACEDFPGNPYITAEDFMHGWFPAVIKEGVRLIRTKQIDAIYSVSAPYVSLLAGVALKRLTGKPLVVDLRDEWTTNPFIQGPRYARDIRANHKFEVLSLQEADAVISVTEQITDTLYQISGTGSNRKFHTIHNGYDPMDFVNIAAKKKNKKFTICYMGSIYGLRRGVANQFFSELNSAISNNIINPDHIELKLIGYLDSITFPEEWPLHHIVHSTGYLNHKTALANAAASDLLLLFIDPREDTTVTSKIYELVRLGKPILALIPPVGSAATILAHTRTGIIVDSKCPSKSIKVIKSLYKAWRADAIKTKPNEMAIQKYSRVKLTGKLAVILDQITSRGGAT
ncbi:glycosyltransferase [Paenibacillus gansuensis]|uniref:Glycosyltransferase n=1 Tax=Paenibacillus gansuensis TaxID=306542 RepID=A0ABW5PJ44_9BACL